MKSRAPGRLLAMPLVAVLLAGMMCVEASPMRKYSKVGQQHICHGSLRTLE